MTSSPLRDALASLRGAQRLLVAGELTRLLRELDDLQQDLGRLARAREQVHEPSSPDDLKDIDEDIETTRLAIERILDRISGHELAASGSLRDQLTEQMEGLFEAFSAEKALEVSKWMRANMRIFTRAPSQAKNIKDSMESLAKLLADVGNRNWVVNVEQYVQQVWKDHQPFLHEVDLLARKGGPAQIELKVDGHTFFNEAGLSDQKFTQYAKSLVDLFGSLKGWRLRALEGGVKVVLAGPRAFRGTAAGKYRLVEDRLYVRATPAILHRGAGTYGAPDYIIVHELGHRFEHREKIPRNFDSTDWFTSTYSYNDGETFAELFALGHFGIEGVHGKTFGDRLARFESVMTE